MALDPENSYRGNILVVDDLPDNLRVLSAKLTAIGYKVRCVTNGEMALVSVNSHQPDLILLDIRMPRIDGYAVCQKLKADPKTKGIPVIFLSAVDNVLDKVKAFEVGGADYITKPFQAEEILARVANQLTIQRLQNQLVTQNQHLQQEIEARRQTEAALQDAKEASEIANYAKSNFIARMSHELRTPLNAILGFAGLIGHDRSLSAEHQDYASSIDQSARHLLQLINQILAITKAEANQITLNQQTFGLRHFLEVTALNWRLQAQKKGLRFSLICAPEVPNTIRTDDGKLQQILTQLLKNAVQFTAFGDISLRVTTEDGGWESPPSDDPDSEFYQKTVPLFFEVEDTGAGIADFEMNRLFQAFSQTESGQKAERGVGLGLYICQQYIQALGGHITLTSVIGRGTTMRFYIPVELGSSKVDPKADLGIAPAVSPLPLGKAGAGADAVAGVGVSGLSLEAAEALMREASGAELSIGWVTQLNRAAIQGFDCQIAQLIQEIPATYSPLAALLADWNKQFQFDQIMTIAQRILDPELGAQPADGWLTEGAELNPNQNRDR